MSASEVLPFQELPAKSSGGTSAALSSSPRLRLRLQALLKRLAEEPATSLLRVAGLKAIFEESGSGSGSGVEPPFFFRASEKHCEVKL